MDKSIISADYYSAGTRNREEIHLLGFDCSAVIKWLRDYIKWIIDDKLVRRVERQAGERFPEMPVFLYASIWDASYIDMARWTGPYIGCYAPYICLYKDVHVPIASPTECSCEP